MDITVCDMTFQHKILKLNSGSILKIVMTLNDVDYFMSIEIALIFEIRAALISAFIGPQVRPKSPEFNV